MTAARRVLAVSAWTASVVAVLVVLQRVGGEALSGPPVAHPGELADWIGSRDPAAVVMGSVRAAALAGCWYLLAATVVGVLVRLAGVGAAVRAADTLTVAPLRRLLHASLGAGMVLAGWAGPAAAAVRPAPDPPVIRWLDDGAEAPPPADGPAAGDDDVGGAVEPAAVPDDGGGAALVPDGDAPQAPPSAEGATGGEGADPGPVPADGAVVDGGPGPSEPPSPAPAGAAPAAADAPAAPPPAPPPPPPVPKRAVKAGESFWRIARTTLAEARGREPTNAEIAPYWRRLIAANQAGLVEPGNPNLLHVGQQLDVPPP